MAAGPVWQQNYVDLCDDRAVRFGAECVICGARYVTEPEPLAAVANIGMEPDPDSARRIEDQKFRLFREFDEAYRGITISCFRCGRPACPDCWDADKQMCGSCVAERGLVRSPYRGGPVEGPLADGFLRRTEAGRYAEVGRPTWLKELLRAQSEPDVPHGADVAAPGPGPSLAPAGGGGAPLVGMGIVGMPSAFPSAPSLPVDPPGFEPPPTAKMPAGAPPPGTVGNRPRAIVDIAGPEGNATSSMLECPRCGAANYDFVTQCSECGLQLIQVCPACEKLNPGHVEACQFCGESLDRPRGWSGVIGPIVNLAPEEARRRMKSRPAAGNSVPIGPQKRNPGVWQRRAGVASGPTVNEGRRKGIFSRPMGGGAEVGLAAGAPAAHPYQPAASMPLQAAGAGPHPYEPASQAVQPILAAGLAPGGQSLLGRLVSGLVLAVEKLLTTVVLLVVVAAVAAVVAAEASAQINHTLFVLTHVDIRQHADVILAWLHNVFQGHQ